MDTHEIDMDTHNVSQKSGCPGFLQDFSVSRISPLQFFSQFLKDLIYLPLIADCLSLGITAEIDQKSTGSGCTDLLQTFHSVQK